MQDFGQICEIDATEDDQLSESMLPCSKTEQKSQPPQILEQKPEIVDASIQTVNVIFYFALNIFCLKHDMIYLVLGNEYKPELFCFSFRIQFTH